MINKTYNNIVFHILNKYLKYGFLEIKIKMLLIWGNSYENK